VRIATTTDITSSGGHLALASQSPISVGGKRWDVVTKNQKKSIRRARLAIVVNRLVALSPKPPKMDPRPGVCLRQHKTSVPGFCHGGYLVVRLPIAEFSGWWRASRQKYALLAPCVGERLEKKSRGMGLVVCVLMF
jgi:hypothetical protein